MGLGYALSDAADFATNQATQLPQFSLSRGIVMQEVIGQADGAKRKTYSLANVALTRNRELATSAAKVNHQHGRGTHAQTGGNPEVNEAGFLEARDDFNSPSRGGAHPFEERARISGITQ